MTCGHFLMHISLHGQIALVTGANSGIGRAIAMSLARAGADVAINFISNDHTANELAHEIEAVGRRTFLIKANVSDEEDVTRMFNSVIHRFGTLHILVNNAGLQADAPIESMTLQQWNVVLNTNLTGQFLCLREASREFQRRGVDEKVSKAAGKVICMSSIHQSVPWAGHCNYAASKSGVWMLMKSAARELAPKRIRVNGIAPGAIKTSINQLAWDTDEARKQLEGLIPYGRIGEVEDIGKAAVWLASDAADYVTGATLTIDGGLSLAI